MFLIFDTETTGLPKLDNAPLADFDNWPRMVQLAWQVHDDQGRFVENHNYLVQPEGFEIPIAAKMVHGISTEHAKKYGKPVVAFAGCVTPDAVMCNEHGIDAFFPILRSVVTIQEAMELSNAYKNMTDTAEQVFRLINIAQKNG